MPPTIHARYTSLAEPTACIISAGTRKMPLPMMVPTTMAVECQTLRSRTSSLRLISVACIRLQRLRVRGHESVVFDQAYSVPNSESHSRPQRDVPGEWNGGPLPQKDVQDQPAEHTNNGAELSGPSGQQPEKKDAEHTSVSDSGDAEPQFQDFSPSAREDRQGKQDHAPDQRGSA